MYIVLLKGLNKGEGNEWDMQHEDEEWAVYKVSRKIWRKQDGHCINVTLRRVRASAVTVKKQ